MVDGSNESFWHGDKEMHHLVRNFSTLQNIFKQIDVAKNMSTTKIDMKILFGSQLPKNAVNTFLFSRTFDKQ